MTFASGTPITDANALPVTVAGDSTRVDYSANVSISNGQSLSPAIDLNGHVLSRIEFPSTWTAGGAGVISFQVSTDGVTYRDLWDENGEVTFQAGANRAVHLGSFGWWTIRYLKIRSGTSATPVVQAADRSIALYSGYKAS